MSEFRLLAALLFLAGLTGCAGAWERSYSRWSDYKSANGPYAKWASCIEDRSHHYLDARTIEAGTDGQIFTDVLSDCRPLMADSDWRYLTVGRAQKLIGDAYQAFYGIGAEITANRDAEII